MGLLCHIDLFRVPANSGSNEGVPIGQRSSPTHMVCTPPPYSQEAHQHYYTFTPPYGLSSTPMRLDQHEASNTNPEVDDAAADDHPDVITTANGFSIVEDTKCTNALVGATFIQPVNVDYNGKKSLLFVFSVSDDFSILRF